MSVISADRIVPRHSQSIFVDGSLVATGTLRATSTVAATGEFRVYNATNPARSCALGVNADGAFTIDASGDVVSFAATDVVRVLSTAASTSTATGALVISGGVGIAGNVNASGTVACAAINTVGLGVGGDAGILGDVSIDATTASTTTATGALVVAGGVGVAGNVIAGGTISGAVLSTTGLGVSDYVSIDGTDASTSTDSGALTVVGGVGIAGDVHIGGTLTLDGGLFYQTLTATATSAGAMVEAVALSLVKIGKVVTLSWGTATATAGTDAAFITLELPSTTWQPAVAIAQMVYVVDNATPAVGTINISGTTVTFKVGSAAQFTTSAVCSLLAGTITYISS